ncbi:MAG: hypothetical protein MJY69_07115 [Bacteroidales bacterium]|nr:hypothetical protein [Bacteroidales bacterium]
MVYGDILHRQLLGFFGGKNHRARNIVIMDPLETGLRATCDFPGVPFSSEGEILIENISIYRGGCTSDPLGKGVMVNHAE